MRTEGRSVPQLAVAHHFVSGMIFRVLFLHPAIRIIMIEKATRLRDMVTKQYQFRQAGVAYNLPSDN